jgi:hypothetical protein
MKPILQADKLIETAKKIRERIGERFPNSSLWRMAGAVVDATKDALAKAEAIRRPNWWLRAALIPLLIMAVSSTIIAYAQHASDDRAPALLTVFHFLDASKGGLAILTGALIFLVSLETRIKRQRVIGAIHQLRGLAHVIDMHGVTKSAGRLGHATQPIDVSGRRVNADDLDQYLQFCTELLAVVSKVGQLYVQDFSDAAALSAVDQFESLATGLSSKIWQKLRTLDSARAEGKGG